MGKSGDFTYASAAKRAAEEYNQTERSDTERAADKAKRAPVTTDYQRWKSDPAGLDFPGVDTPTGSPGVLPKDLKQGETPELSARAQNERPAAPVERSTKELDRREAKMRGVSPQVEETDPTRSFEDELIDPGERRAAGGRRGNVPQGFVDNLATGREADMAFMDAEQNRGSDTDRQLFDLPDETLSFARTQLNEKVYGEGRDDLDDLRERITIGEPLELDRGEYRTVKNVVFDAADEAKDRAERMNRNIFGDTDEQAEFADTARQGIISNPPEFGGGRR